MFKNVILYFLLSSGAVSFVQPAQDELIKDFYRFQGTARMYQNRLVDSSILYTDSCLQASLQIESPYFFGKALQLKTRGKFYASELDSAIICGNRSVEILQEYPDSMDYFTAEYNLGNMYLSKDDHIQALIQFKKAAKIIDEHFEHYLRIDTDKVHLARGYCQTSLATVYQKLEDFESAERTLKRAIKISYGVDSGEGDVLRSVIFGNLGRVYYYLGDYQMSESYAIAGLERKKKLGQESSIGYNYQVLAMSAFGRGKYDLSLKYLDQATKKFELRGNNFAVEFDRNTFWRAKNRLSQGKVREGTEILKNLEESYLANFGKKELACFYELFSDGCRQLSEHKLANDYLRIALELRKEVDVKNDRRIVKEFTNFFDSKEVQLNSKIQNLKNKQEKEKLELQIENDHDKKVWIYTLFLVSIICLVLIIMVIANAYRRNKKITRDLSDSIEENKILFKEVHHRVKNNFQIISSLLNLQHGIEEDEHGRKVLTDAQGRIQSMSLVHEMLYRKNEVKSIDFRTYAKELVSSIIKSFTDSADMIEYEITSKDESFDLEVAIPLGLILNESITNSVKYAFNDLMIGEIKVGLNRIEDNNFELIIQDNGSGIPEEYLNGKIETLGIELISILSQQLGGSVEITNDNGTKIRVEFQA